jgi:hypothetical protein
MTCWCVHRQHQTRRNSKHSNLHSVSQNWNRVCEGGGEYHILPIGRICRSWPEAHSTEGATRGHTLEASGGTLGEQTWQGTAGAHLRRKTTTWGKPTILGVTIDVRRWAATTSPSMAMALASAAVASAAGIACVKR